ncbi:MAG: YbhN family protein [Halobacteriaceae archaeon]
MDADWRSVIVGFVAAAAILAGLIYVVGADEVFAALAMLETRDFLLLVGATSGYLLAWSLALRTVLSALDVEATLVESVLLFTSATFANNVTPFGQAGGEPFSALLVARATDSEYEASLAAIASVDTINFIPSIVLSGLGLAYYLAVFAVGDQLVPVVAVVLVLALGVPLVGYLVWRFRRRLQRVIVGIVHPITAILGRYVPSFVAPSRPNIRRRVRGFFTAIERVADSRATLVEALLFSAMGWGCMALALWLALGAVGHAVPIAAALIAAPVGAIASVTPLPGGLGGVELAVVLIVVPITTVTPEIAASAALVYRGATYWLPTVGGGMATVFLESRVGR